MEKNTAEIIKDAKASSSSSGDSRKSSMRNKIGSATQLSKDVNFVSSEVTGCIPILPSSSVSGIDSQFTMPNHGTTRKVIRVSSGTTSASTEKNEKKTGGGGRGRQPKKTKKRKHRHSSSSSSGSSSSRSSSSSSSSSSSGSSSEDYHYFNKKKSKKKKRKSSPNSKMEKVLQKCEKHISAKVAKDMDKYTKKMKDDIVSSVTTSILHKLDGAVLQSYVVPNNGSSPPQASPVINEANNSATSSKVEPAPTNNKRMRYQHLNVICDHCETEIFGPRYKCGNRSDYDPCENCESIEGLHTPSHVFVKMHYPAALVGRRSVGGRSRPLLRANIYEEREKEREMEIFFNEN